MAKDDGETREESASCCVPAASGCASSKEKDIESLEIDLSNIDVNEWVGKFFDSSYCAGLILTSIASFKIFAIKN